MAMQPSEATRSRRGCQTSEREPPRRVIYLVLEGSVGVGKSTCLRVPLPDEAATIPAARIHVHRTPGPHPPSLLTQKYNLPNTLATF